MEYKRRARTQGWCVQATRVIRCVKGYSAVVLTGTDARAVRPYFKFAE